MLLIYPMARKHNPRAFWWAGPCPLFRDCVAQRETGPNTLVSMNKHWKFTSKLCFPTSQKIKLLPFLILWNNILPGHLNYWRDLKTISYFRSSRPAFPWITTWVCVAPYSMALINFLIQNCFSTFSNFNLYRIILSRTHPSYGHSMYSQSLRFLINIKPSSHHLTYEWNFQKCFWLFEPREQLCSITFPVKKQDICLMTSSSLPAASLAALSSVHLAKWASFHPRKGPQQP